jgi:hypothetical protein
MKQVVLLLLFWIGSMHSSTGQVSFSAQAGLSYIEHFSTGLTCTVSNKHSVAVLYGSDFFIKPQRFSAQLLQYDFSFHKLMFHGMTPKLGIKGGNHIYTSDYYRWRLAVIIPFLGVNYPVNEKIKLIAEAGVCISLEQTMKRVNPGEIEAYKEILPEIKTGVLYKLGKR